MVDAIKKPLKNHYIYETDYISYKEDLEKLIKKIKYYFEDDCVEKIIYKSRYLISLHDDYHYSIAVYIWIVMLPNKGNITKPYYEKFLPEFFGYFEY